MKIFQPNESFERKIFSKKDKAFFPSSKRIETCSVTSDAQRSSSVTQESNRLQRSIAGIVRIGDKGRRSRNATWARMRAFRTTKQGGWGGVAGGIETFSTCLSSMCLSSMCVEILATRFKGFVKTRAHILSCWSLPNGRHFLSLDKRLFINGLQKSK